MSSKDDAHGGRFEPQTSRAASPGMVITSQCDECQSQGSSAGRRRMRVARGPLRGAGGQCVPGLCGAAGSGESGSMIKFTIPGEPQGKGRPKVVKIAGFTRMATPAKTVAYEGLVAHAAQVAMAGRPMFTEAVACDVSICAPVPASWSAKKQRMALAGEVLPTTKPDADNVVKAVFDGLNGVLWRDDVLVVDLRVRKRYAATPCVHVAVRPAVQPVSQGLQLEQAA